MKNNLKIGLVQYAPVWENKAECIEKIKNLVKQKSPIVIIGDFCFLISYCITHWGQFR